ncbi:CHAT domain-containing protein [Sabulilitoribacter multivorans]|uniref:CHAT domain-containing protein n=1 Tax=Flaviramulus multivorans TaxID=1304750 RepID=A0ABS9IIS1_9FLAO|nr:CHAT domain-containing tetratricopeptide repeat protein [Flaviramulus multivorans]MCF7560565.1 CHAT domain-containing protein [Flaviramulus multivorans]
MTRIKYYKVCFVILLLGIISLKSQAQNNTTDGISYIEELIKNDSLQLAEKELKAQIEYLRLQKNYDSLTYYIPLVGSYNLAQGNYQEAIKKATLFVNELKSLNDNNITTDALIQLSNIYFNARQHDKVYEVNNEALEYAKFIKKDKSSKISQLHYNLGTASLNLGRVMEGKNHLYESKRILEDSPNQNLINLYNTYNSIGRLQSSLTQIDSSIHYYQKALKTLTAMDSTEVNRDYWKAIVNNNISLNYQNIGKTDKAIEFITDAIYDFQKFINVSNDESKKLRAKRYRLATIDNLSTFYEGIGEYNRALELVLYSYEEKLKFLKTDDPNVVFSLVILAHMHLKVKDFKKAAVYADKALDVINKSPSNFSLVHSFTLSIRASIYRALNNFNEAKKMYEESELLYNKTFDGSYSIDRLDAIIEMSKFYAKINDSKKALQLATSAYNYTKQNEFENTLMQFHHTVNMAEVYFELKKYNDALSYSNKALEFFSENKLQSQTLSDSIQQEFKKPKAILVNVKSKYYLATEHSESFLIDLLKQINNSIKILEQRKSITKSYDDLSLLIVENNELFNFSKQLLLDLFHLTNKEDYLIKLLTIHESSIYNRIRTRLNLKNNITFANIPKAILDRENLLKHELSTSIKNDDGSFKSFFEKNNNWKIFLDSLKQTYPKYYKMRYATIEEPLNDIHKKIQQNTTVIRYLFANENLYVVVLSANSNDIFKVDTENISNYISELSENQSSIKSISIILHELYQKLWKPIEHKIKTENIIIIPDGALFNLSFETLTPKKISSFKELGTMSLLSKHSISYNYSLLLLDKNKKTINYQNDFIAFAPEFTDKMKKDYRVAITDSVSVDKTYLSLLPQPFSVDLAKKYSRLFNGSFFINENASKKIFKNEANEHKIIHIGTHAESNNITPELSRLIFAKNNPNDNNSLYTYEIYNESLNSNLAILTACETGKPSYQAGEGMISLAHAFNYAGSESILTSLWKIDEQSSAKIIELFYDNIKNGLPKDQALQKAKIDYIVNAEGRTVAPQYWAGLVLIGDTAPIDLQITSYLIWYILVTVFIILALVFFLKRRK